MPLDPTSPLANNMDRKNHDANFDKFWVIISHSYWEESIALSKSFNTLVEAKKYMKMAGKKSYEVFYGRKLNITMSEEDKVEKDNLRNNIDTKG